MDTTVLKILGFLGALGVVWWMHVRNKNFNADKSEMLLPTVFVPMLFFAGLLIYKLIEDMHEQEIPEIFLFNGFIVTASFSMISFFPFLVWLRASRKRA